MEKQLLWNILNSEDPAKELSELDDAAILEHLLPELTALKGVDIKGGQGHKDNFVHTLQVVKQTSESSKNPWLRLIAILHDVGKSTTKRFENGKGWTFQNHELVSARIAKDVTKEEVSESSIRRFSTELGEWVDDLILFCKCDMTTASYAKRQRFTNDLDRLKDKIINVRVKDEVRSESTR